MKYVLFIRNEGGYDVCRSELYNDQLGTKVGEFNKAGELADLLHQDDPEWFSEDFYANLIATEMIVRLWVKEEEVVQ